MKDKKPFVTMSLIEYECLINENEALKDGKIIYIRQNVTYGCNGVSWADILVIPDNEKIKQIFDHLIYLNDKERSDSREYIQEAAKLRFKLSKAEAELNLIKSIKTKKWYQL